MLRIRMTGAMPRYTYAIFVLSPTRQEVGTMKKTAIFLLTLLTLALLLCSCSNGSGPSDTEGEQKPSVTSTEETQQPSGDETQKPSGDEEEKDPLAKTATGTRIWDVYHPDEDTERYPYFCLPIPEFDYIIVEYDPQDCTVYADGEELLVGPGVCCQSFYLSDITGDGCPELCFAISYGSGMVDIRVVIIDYTTKETIFTLSGRGRHDYYLFLRDGILCVKETEYMKDEPTRTGALTYNGTEISVAWDSEVNYNFDRDEVTPDETQEVTLTIVESLPGCDAFEYHLPSTSYCFYASDKNGALYRVNLMDLDELNEKRRIRVKYDNIIELTYDEPTGGGFTPKYEIDATEVMVLSYEEAACISKEGDNSILTLPLSQKKINLKSSSGNGISDGAIFVAESRLMRKMEKYEYEKAGISLEWEYGIPYLKVEIIVPIDEYPIDHKHVFFSEAISC